MKKETTKTASSAALAGGAFVALLGTALPLAVHDAYFDITRTKAAVFWVLGGIIAAAALLIAIRGEKEAHAASPLRAVDICFIVFVLCQTLSTLIFRGAPGVIASDNRFQGVLCFALYLCVFLLLRRGGGLCSGALFGLTIGFCVAAALGIANYFGADVLPLRSTIPEDELPRFFSTVGNISFYGAMCVLFLPLYACLALGAGSRGEAIVFSLCALTALWGGMASRVESFVFGALVFFALQPALCREEKMLRRTPLLWAGAAAAAGLFTAAARAWGLYRLSDLTALICTPWLLAGVFVLSALLWLYVRRLGADALIKLRKVYIILFAACLTLIVVLFVLANTVLKGSIGGTLGSVLVFSPSWGSDRGAVWASFIEMFKSSSPLQKLIGSGAGAAAEWDRAHRVFSDAVTDNAHNEYLHYLLSSGMIGLVAYLSSLVLAARTAYHSGGRMGTALLLSGAAYAAQAAVNIAQPVTTPLFIVFLALMSAESRENDGRAIFGDAELFSRVLLVGVAAALLTAAAIAR